MQARFPFRFDPAYRRLARLFGVTPERAWVDLGDEELEARYGWWRVRTPRSNIAGVEATGPYLFLKTAGPARLAITDRGLTFASNRDRGACISFHSPVVGIDPFGLIHHPTLTVTVLDVDGLVEALVWSKRWPSRTRKAREQLGATFSVQPRAVEALSCPFRGRGSDPCGVRRG